MLYVANREFNSQEIIDLKNENIGIRHLDCFEFNKSELHTRVMQNVTGNSFILNGKIKVILENSNKLSNGLINDLFKLSVGKDIYLINISKKQEKYIYKKYKGKYKYYKSKYDSTNEYFLNVKKLMYLPNGKNRIDLYDTLQSYSYEQLKYIVKVMGYNIPNTNMSIDSMLYNIDVITLAYNTLLDFNTELSKDILLNLFDVPSYGKDIKYPKNPKKNNDSKNKKINNKHKKISFGQASEVMTSYFYGEDDNDDEYEIYEPKKIKNVQNKREIVSDVSNRKITQNRKVRSIDNVNRFF